ncbi:MAG: aspartate aminotransferase family protein [Epsilonproteobacteria bacterium]|nr:aspartate aminotransferase family protein [Campylobacterota bacterium]
MHLDKQYVLPTYNRNYINFTRGKNATLFDEQEQEYIDFTSGIGVVSVGHANERLANVICKQASSIIHISNLYYIQPQAQLAYKIAQLSGIEGKCFFANSGAEANEGAIKIARKYGEVNGEIKRYKVITLQNSFHGRTITTVKATGQEKMHASYFSPYPDGFVYADDIADIYNKIDDKTVAVMIELIQGEGGVYPFDKGEVQALHRYLKQHDILLIVDEVQTGVYRTGEFLASNLYNIQPDIITLAKGLGGGVPIGAILTTLDVLKAGDHGSTFGGNYLSSAAGCEVCDILSQYKQTQMDSVFEYFHQKLVEVFEEFRHLFTEVAGIGMMRALRCKDDQTQEAIYKLSHKHHVLVLKAGRSSIRFLPPLTITKEEIDKGFASLKAALQEVE